MNITLIASLISGSIAFAGAWAWQANSYGEKIATMQREQATAAHKQLDQAHAQTIELQAKADAAALNHASRAAALANAAAGARTDLERLRDTIATGPVCMPSDSGSASAVHTDTARQLLSECAGVVADMAAKADGHASDAVMLLEAWPVQSKP
jgi:hypothetical protein